MLDGCAATVLPAGERTDPPDGGDGELVDVCERMGRANATAFLLAWYARIAAGSPEAEAFDQAFAETGMAEFPEPLQPSRTGGRELSNENYRASGNWTDEPRVTVWYGTNRRPQDPDTQEAEPYGTTPDDSLHTGCCVVSVPKAMQLGRLRQRRSRSLGQDRLRLLEHRAMAGEAYWQALRDALHAAAEPGEGCILLYLHGYRTLFTEAALRAAQLHADLKVPGVTAFFSWPSLGRTGGYLVDEDTVQHAERHLCRFLRDLCVLSGARKVHVLAHSMGNRAMLRVAMRVVEHTSATEGIALGQVILAAPDVGAQFFGAEAVAYRPVADGTTLYVSSKDKALRSSGILHGSPRAGFAPPLTLMDGIHTIETDTVDLTMLGHGYFAQARPVLADIHDLLHGARHPSARMGLRPGDAGPNHWVFRD
ncbi:alpha/beta hydrolase [Streptacidiphilus carbonis]|uniref:alpha/beta hydrolase n=1 Tax=Streptacidiphilus carbonis TaxID=105422 RepID=UPI00126A52DC|nr:alpha/beta hydrolase [Streptacidiphilus carbonis]